jgi:hypothetical protein
MIWLVSRSTKNRTSNILKITPSTLRKNRDRANIHVGITLLIWIASAFEKTIDGLEETQKEKGVEF